MNLKRISVFVLAALVLIAQVSVLNLVFAAGAGDINNDGAVNNKDLTRLFQYLSEWDVEVDAQALDVNGDGEVNNKDLTRLFQYLSEWDVEINYTSSESESSSGSKPDDGAIYLPEVP